MSEPLVTTRAAEWMRYHDASDVAKILGVLSDDAQGIDEVARRWLRGRATIGALAAEAFPRVQDMHSTIEDYAVRRFGEVEVETFMLHQTYTFDGVPVAIEAPTTIIWRQERGDWKVVLYESIPLPTPSE